MKESNPIHYYKGLKYQLSRDVLLKTDINGYVAETNYLSLDEMGWLRIKRGYAWDGASGPTIDTKSSMRGGLVHDALYQLIRLGCLPESHRLFADRELKKTCIKDKMLRLRANIWFFVLRKFGGPAAQEDHRRKEYTAP